MSVIARVGRLATLCCLTVRAAQGQAARARPVTVADMIRMTKVAGDEPWNSAVTRPAVFSGSARHFAFVIERGDLERNATLASIVVFRAADVFQSPKPDTIVTFASTSSRPAISSVRWMPGDSVLLFLGERPGQVPQVYRVDLRTRVVKALTHGATPVTLFDVSANGARVFYAAARAPDTAANADRAARGFVVTQTLRDLLRGKWDQQKGQFDDPQDLYALSLRDGRASVIRAPGLVDCAPPVHMDPTGRFATAMCHATNEPAYWHEYLDGLRGWAVVPAMALVDLVAGRAVPLVDAPWYRTEAGFSPDGSHVLVLSALLPLTGVDSAERASRKNRPGVAMVDASTGHLDVLTSRDSLELARWSADGQTVVLRSTGADKREVAFRRSGASWTAADPSTVMPASAHDRPIDVVVEEDLNAPPRVVAIEHDRRAVIFDPNPGFSALAFGREEDFKWRTADGEWEGGLYYPVGYTPGRRYPLVIQTHGFEPGKFQISGYGITGYAAQALAGQGIVVLQVGNGPRAAERRTLTTSEEGPFNVRGLEAAIDTLARAGLVDTTRIGLQGWSRTTFHVRHMLVRSHYAIRAALISDGVDFGYVRYTIDDSAFRAAAEGITGAPPVGDRLKVWQERIPTLRAAEFRAPVRIESIGYPGGGGPLTQWELYTMLARLGKPVELVYYPRGEHSLATPWERMTSQGGALDWFRFWLVGEEDRDPAKAEQYRRWRAMRDGGTRADP